MILRFLAYLSVIFYPLINFLETHFQLSLRIVRFRLYLERQWSRNVLANYEEDDQETPAGIEVRNLLQEVRRAHVQNLTERLHNVMQMIRKFFKDFALIDFSI